MGDVPLDLEAPYRLNDPLEMDDARRASRRVAEIRRDAERAHREAVEAKADAERDYREAYAKEIVRLKADGEASTTAAERARGEDNVKDKLRAFRLAEGMVDAAKERLRGVEGERSLLKSLIDASARMMYGPEARPPDGRVYGAGEPGIGVGEEYARGEAEATAWACSSCGQRNAGWADRCGRCAMPRVEVEA